MSLIRARQRAITGIFPHNANRRFLIPSRFIGAEGVIPDQVDVVLVPITPLDTSAFFNGVDPKTYAATGLPPGLSIDVDTGIITGAGSQIDAALPVTVSATNLAGSRSQSFTWEITL